MTTSADPLKSLLRGIPQPRTVLLVCLLAGYALQIDQNMITVALPSIEKVLDLSSAQSTWAVSGYILAFALTLVLGGRLGDDFGRRRVLLVAMGLFVATTLASDLAQSGDALAIARTVDGAVAGIALPQIVGLIQQLFGGDQRGHAFGFYSATVSLSAVFAPLIGGGLIDASRSGWHLVFGPSALISLAALIAGVCLLPKDQPGTRSKIDFTGTVLLGVSLLAIMYPVIQQGEKGATPAWWLTAVGIVLLGVFCWWENRLELARRAPMVRIDLFRDRNFSVGALTVMFFFAGYPGMLLVAQLYLQRGLHESAFSSGATSVPFGVASALAALFSGRLVNRYGRWTVVLGTLLVTAGVALTAVLVSTRLHGDQALWLIIPFVISGIGAGLIIAPNQTLSLARVPRDQASTAAGVYQVGMRIGQSIGAPLALSLYSSGLHRFHGDVFRAASFAMTASAALIGLALLTRVIDICVGRSRSRGLAHAPAHESMGAMAESE